jgi:hypothetical protein
MKGTDPYSYPPRGLAREEAARYIGVSPNKFEELVASGRMPKPKWVDRRRVWDRYQLDVAFNELTSSVTAEVNRLVEAGAKVNPVIFK